MWCIIRRCLPRRWIKGLVQDPDAIKAKMTGTARQVQKVRVCTSRALFTSLYKQPQATAAAYIWFDLQIWLAKGGNPWGDCPGEILLTISKLSGCFSRGAPPPGVLQAMQRIHMPLNDQVYLEVRLPSLSSPSQTPLTRATDAAA